MNSFKKYSMAAALAGLGAIPSTAEIKLSDNLSTSGFLDMAILGVTHDDVNSLNASLDQFELDFMYKYGDKVSARVDLAYGGVGGGSTTAEGTLGGVGFVNLEQGFVTATLGALSISSGRFLSSSGWEAAEPTGMYQYSYSENITGPAGAVYGGYQNGINFAYSTPMFGIYGAFVADLWSTADTDIEYPGFEGQLSVMPIPGLTAKLAYLYQMHDEDATDDASQQLINFWASYATGPITVAGEFNYLMDWDAPGAGPTDEDGMGYLVMANYKFTPIFAATLRHSSMIYADLDPTMEFTVSPSVAVAANWLALAEFRYDIDPDEISDEPTISYALETTFTF